MDYELVDLIDINDLKKGLSLAVSCDGELLEHIKTDKRKLNQVLSNLLSNAIKYTESDGVALRVSGSRSDPNEYTRTQEGNASPATDQPTTIWFEIEDTGIGIVPADLDKIFKPCSQVIMDKSSRAGTGLGLAIVKQFLRQWAAQFP